MKIKKIVAGILSMVMTASLVAGTTVVSQASTSEAVTNDTSQQLWHATAFGQSTDLNFSTNVLPNKIGTDYVWSLGQTIKDHSTALSIDGKTVQDVSIESRGGKIAVGHDGLTYYYTELPTNKNFVLTADVTVTQCGPEVGVVDATGKQVSANAQEGAGIMIRDVNGPARQDPFLEGYAEYPAASNMLMFYYSNMKGVNPDLYLSTLARYGVDEKCGLTTNIASKSDSKTFAASKLTADANGSYSTQKLKVEKTDTSFICTLLDQDGNVVTSYNVSDQAGNDYVTPNMLSQLDTQKYTLGFFCSRNQAMNVENINLTTSDVVVADTTPYYVASLAEKADLKVSSSNSTNSDNYILAGLPTHTGTVTVVQDGNTIVTDAPVTTWQQYALNTTITGATSTFVITYKANVAATGEPQVSNANVGIPYTVTVTKSEYNKDLYVSPTGTGTGTVDSPMSVATAITKLVPGGTIHMLPGEYTTAITIARQFSGTKDNRKSLVADGAVVIKGKMLSIQGDFWNVTGIDVNGNKSVANSIQIKGNYNIIEKCTTHDGIDTGFYLVGAGPTNKSVIVPSYNTVRYCESYNNWDASAKNADGFAAKLGVGTGNLFEYCVSHDNADDGWDCLQKLGESTNGPTTISHCISYNNGGNGYKLGGESLPVTNTLKYSIAYSNHLTGITDNFNPGALTIVNNIAFNNYTYNMLISKSVYAPAATISNNVSFKTQLTDLHHDDYITAKIAENNTLYDKDTSILNASDFISLDTNDVYSWNESHELVYGNCFVPTFNSPINPGSGVFNAKLNLNVITDNGTATGTGTYVKDQNIDISALANDGYEFDSWVVNSGTATFANVNSSITTVLPGSENVEIKAVFRKAQTSVVGVNSTPVTIQEDIVSADIAQSTAVSDMKTITVPEVKVFSTTAPTVNSDLFNNMKDNQKDVTFGVVNEKKQLQYSWTFKHDTLKNTDKTIDLSVKFDIDRRDIIEKITGKNDGLYLSFAYHGELPGPVLMKNYVGDQYKNGDVIYLYYYNEDAGKVESVGNALTVQSGYVEYTISHCSVYFLSQKTPEVLGVQAEGTIVKPAVINDNPAVVNEKPTVVNDNPAVVNDNQIVTNENLVVVNDNQVVVNENQSVATGDIANPFLFTLLICSSFGLYIYAYKRRKVAR